MKCPFCAETIKDEAIVCRYCGRDVPKTSNQMDSQGENQISATAPSMNRNSVSKQRILLGVATALVLGIGGFFILGGESGAVKECKQEVAGYLKQPSSAEWQEISETEVLSSDDRIVMDDGKVVKDTTTIIRGSVKAQNDFGAMKLINFKCERPIWEDYWEIETWADGDSEP